jgi:hypothetical protein
VRTPIEPFSSSGPQLTKTGRGPPVFRLDSSQCVRLRGGDRHCQQLMEPGAGSWVVPQYSLNRRVYGEEQVPMSKRPNTAKPSNNIFVGAVTRPLLSGSLDGPSETIRRPASSGGFTIKFSATSAETGCGDEMTRLIAVGWIVEMSASQGPSSWVLKGPRDYK